MANIPPATQDGAQLTKPVDWAMHMVIASLKFSSSIDAPVSSYTTPDAGRLDVLNVLNWHETHDEYEWPDITKLGLDFAQAMRFRRALVNDIFVALQKAGVIKITGEPGVLGTPQSAAEGERRVGANVGMRMSERKRHCRRENSSDTEIAPEEEVPYYETDQFLANSMRSLIGGVDLAIKDCVPGLEQGVRVSEEGFSAVIRDMVVTDQDLDNHPWMGSMDISKADIWKMIEKQVRKNEKASRLSSLELGTGSVGAGGKHPSAMSALAAH